MVAISPLSSPPASLFESLRHHARARPETIACASRFRMASYRKVWSRIERATARLQGEWQVRPGDVVAYCGHGHPDALVLYLALARCGAMLLPLEHAAGRAALAGFAASLPLRLALFDDDSAHPLVPASAYPLSALIGSPCPHQAHAAAVDPSAPSLLQVDASGEASRRSLLQLQAAVPAGSHEVRGSLFDADVFGPVVLPALMAGKTLRFP
jgi:acyl-coenzyme A synthetase/AMP-(fatty) acid ligase